MTEVRREGIIGRKRERVFKNNYKRHIDKTRGAWNQKREVGMAKVGAER